MAFFKVNSIDDARTFSVVPGWQWRGQRGTRVRAIGIGAPDTVGDEDATCQLRRLMLNRTVVLGFACRIEQGCLICEVFLDGIPIERYLSGGTAV